jgi:hypothetical protein
MKWSAKAIELGEQIVALESGHQSPRRTRHHTEPPGAELYRLCFGNAAAIPRPRRRGD